MNILGGRLSFNWGRKNETAAVNKNTGNTRERVKPLDSQIIEKLVKQYIDRSRKEIQKWRNAIKIAENPEKPRRYLMQDLYTDIRTDGHLQSLIKLRKYATLNTSFSIKDKDGKVNEEATNFLNKAWFYSFLSHAMDSIFLGTTVIDFTSFSDKKATFYVVPRRNIVPELKAIFPDVTKDEYIRYDDPEHENWIVEITHDETPYGLLNDIIPNLIWKRNVAQSWAEFCEKFGLPLITATTNSSDQKVIDLVETQLKALGEASIGVFPIGTTIEFKEANRTDAYEVYNKFVEMNKDEIAAAIVGGTMITQDGSSRSQSEVHERNLNEKIGVSDKRFIKFLVDDQIIPMLINQGYSFFKEGEVLEFDQSHDLDLDKLWTIVSGMIDKGHEPDAEWLSKTFSIPLTEKKKSPIKPVALFIPNNIKLPNYPDACCDGGIMAVSKRFEKRLQEYQDSLAKELWDNKDTLSSEAQIIAAEGMELLKGLHEGWGKRRIEAAWNEPDHLALSMMEYNLFEFAETKTEARLAAMSNLLINKDKAQIRSFDEFKQEAAKLTSEFNTNWLETEYNLSVATGQTSANYLRFMSEKDTVTAFVQYQTAGDSKVRQEHAALNGLIFSLDDKEAMKLNPPNAHGCRCELVQYIGDTKGKITSGAKAVKALGEKFKQSDFNINRGDLKQVFTQAQYYAGLNGKKFEKMRFDTAYNLTPYADMKGLKNAALDASITPGNVAELFKETAGSNLMGFEDYLKRKMVLTKKNFNKHTKGKYVSESENRHQLFPLLKNVLLSPDEVWLKPQTKQTFYLKFFKDFVFAAPVNIAESRVEVGTWFKMRIDENVVRSGVLIHKKTP